MDAILMNSENSKTSEPHVLILRLTDRLDFKRVEKSIAFLNLSIYYTWKNIKNLYNNNKFKISAHTWNDKFELRNGWDSVSDIDDYFEYILKKHEGNNDNPSVRIYVNKTENRITFTINTGYYLELLTPATMKPPGSTENKITKDKNGEKVPHLEITEVVLVHFNIVNNGSRVLYTFAPNKPFGSLLEISPKNHIFKKTFNSELQTVEVWFTDQNSQPLEIEQVKLNNAGIIKMRYSIESMDRIYVKGHGFFFFFKNMSNK